MLKPLIWKQTFTFLLFILAYQNNSSGQENKYDLNTLSFENGIPAFISSSVGNLEISNDHYSEGKHGLKWEYSPDDTLVIRKKIGYQPQVCETHKTILDSTYCLLGLPTGFIFPIYNEKRSSGHLEIQFGRGKQTDCTVKVLLDFTGWRKIKIIYDRGHLTGQPHVDMNQVNVIARSKSRGTLYLDNWITSQKMDPRHDVLLDPILPSVKFHPQRRGSGNRINYTTHLNRPWFPIEESVKTEDIQAFKTIENRLIKLEWNSFDVGKSVFFARHFEKLKKEYEEFEIVRTEHSINGLHLDNGTLRKKYCTLAKNIGIAYQSTIDSTYKEFLGSMLTDMIDHGIDSDVRLNWYHGRGFADACFLARDLLTSSRRAHVIDFLRRKYDFNMIYNEDNPSGIHGGREISSDHLYTNYVGMLICVLMMRDTPEKVRDMNHMVSFYSNIAFNYAPGIADTFKPDGSHYHHANAALSGYGNYTMSTVSKFIRLLSQTSFRIYEDAHLRMKKNLMIRRFYRSRNHLPWAYAHNSIRPNDKVNPNEFLHLSLAGSPDGKESIDEELGAAYLRIMKGKELPKEASPIRDLDILAESDPEGHHTLSYYAKGIHRRDNWFVTIGAFSKYIYQTESWHWKRGNIVTNQFLNWGMMEIIYPDKQEYSFINNGWDLDGWDWTRFPGTTAIHAPIDRIKTLPLKNGDDEDEHLRSDQPFVGGLDLSDGNGVFTSIIRGHDKYKLESFYATKSWVFFDNLIVCIGSGITNDLSDYNTETTLIQNSKKHNSSEGYYQQMKESNRNKGIWMIDGRSTGYYIPANQQVYMNNGLQKSRDMTDQKDTKGLFETVWIDHGKSPLNASYEYAALINTSKEEMKQFHRDMEKSNQPPYEVVQQDQDGHIVKSGNHTAYIMFNQNHEINFDQINGVSHSSILMTKEDGNQLQLAVSDPDLRFYEGYGPDVDLSLKRHETSAYGHHWFNNESIPSTIKVFLKGYWEIKDNLIGTGKIIQKANDVTVIEFKCQHGLTSEVLLRKQ
ncbi:MAG: hypothetical protein JXR03_04855 [Cyclobacteriaceae bacterium]